MYGLQSTYTGTCILVHVVTYKKKNETRYKNILFEKVSAWYIGFEGIGGVKIQHCTSMYGLQSTYSIHLYTSTCSHL